MPIDDVRVLSNISTGELGQTLAKELANKGAKVTVLEGPVPQALKLKSVRVLKFRFFDELQRLLNQELKKKYDVIIHAAAVSDFRLKRVFMTKLGSGKRLKLELVPTPKLIESIKRKNPNAFLVGFKLEPNLSPNSAKGFARDLFKKAKCDLVVANSVSRGKYQGYIINRQHILIYEKTKKQLTQILVKILTKINNK